MHILFVHQDFPAQFGHIARDLIRTRGWSCSFVSKAPIDETDGIRGIEYTTKGGARETSHYCSRPFENTISHAHGVFEACKAWPDLRPDLIVGHSGFGSTLFLPELFPDVPIVNYFEFYYHPHESDMDFRPEFPPDELDYLRVRARNAMILLDLEACSRGFSPTQFQRQLFPAAYRPKIDVIFDGIETEVFRRRAGVTRRICGRSISESTRIVTYVSRGFEAMRGFDIFMQVAQRIYRQFPDVVFVLVGTARICYGGDAKHIQHDTFLEHVLAQSDYDLSKFLFAGLLSATDLADVLSLSDLHIYLTVPFVLSWSLMDALACGCTVLASDTAPVREMIEDGRNGRLCGFFDVDGFATRAIEVLREPGRFQYLGREAAARVRRDYSIDVTLPRLARFFEQVVESGCPQNATRTRPVSSPAGWFSRLRRTIWP
jgi:glycosyltransferase involved in cell wall biosynthesis